LQTPLFRVRNKRKAQRGKKNDGGEKQKGEFETIYCYSEEERIRAIEKLAPNPEITRFKGLGEISPDEFRRFIGPEIRLEQVTMHKDDKVDELLRYYMDKNTIERQNFIIDNLVVEEDTANEE
jgi:topoisomerase-4 subunit B